MPSNAAMRQWSSSCKISLSARKRSFRPLLRMQRLKSERRFTRTTWERTLWDMIRSFTRPWSSYSMVDKVKVEDLLEEVALDKEDEQEQEQDLDNMILKC